MGQLVKQQGILLVDKGAQVSGQKKRSLIYSKLSLIHHSICTMLVHLQPLRVVLQESAIFAMEQLALLIKVDTRIVEFATG